PLPGPSLAWIEYPLAALLSCSERMRLLPLCRDLAHGFERHTLVPLHVLDQLLQHENAMAAADHLRVHGQRKDSLTHALIEKVEICRPDARDVIRVAQAHMIRGPVQAEIGPIIETPVHR